LLLSGCGSRSAAPTRSSRGETASRDDPSRIASPIVVAHDSADASNGDDWFDDVTKRAGIDFAYRNGREAGRLFMIESFGGGAAVVDYDRDGDMDMLITGGGTFSTESPIGIAGLPSALFRNDGDWRFVNVTGSAGLSNAPDYSQGCAITDLNVDGFPDFLVC